MRPHPLTTLHSALRETACWFVGHKWTSSWRPVAHPNRRTKRRTRASAPYAFVATWQHKCRRCRLRVHGDAWYPWYRVAQWAAQSFARSFGTVCSVYRESGTRSWLAVLGVALTFGATQAWGYLAVEWRWPWWPMEVLDVLEHWCARHADEPPPAPPRTLVACTPTTATANTAPTVTLHVACAP